MPPKTPANVLLVSVLEVGSSAVDVGMGTVNMEVESDGLGVGAVDAKC